MIVHASFELLSKWPVESVHNLKRLSVYGEHGQCLCDFIEGAKTWTNLNAIDRPYVFTLKAAHTIKDPWGFITICDPASQNNQKVARYEILDKASFYKRRL